MKLALLTLTASFAAYSSWVMWQVGYVGIWQGGFGSIGATQVTIDLIIAGLLLCGWMIRDARERGRRVWPYVVLTVAAGSFGPLLYLIMAPPASDSPA